MLPENQPTSFRWLGQAAALWAIFCLYFVHMGFAAWLPITLLHSPSLQPLRSLHIIGIYFSALGVLSLPAGLLIDRLGALRSAVLGFGLMAVGLRAVPAIDRLGPAALWVGGGLMAFGVPLTLVSLTALVLQRQRPFTLRLTLTLCGLLTCINLGSGAAPLAVGALAGSVGLTSRFALLWPFCLAGAVGLLAAHRHLEPLLLSDADRRPRGFGWALLVLLAAAGARFLAGAGQEVVEKAWDAPLSGAFSRYTLLWTGIVVKAGAFFLTLPLVLLIVRLLPRGELGAAIRLSLAVVLSSALFVVGTRLGTAAVVQGGSYAMLTATLMAALADLLGMIASLELLLYWLPTHRHGTALGLGRVASAGFTGLRAWLGR